MFAFSRLSVHYLKRTASTNSNTSSSRDDDNLYLIVEDKNQLLLDEGAQKHKNIMGDNENHRDMPLQRKGIIKGLMETYKWLLFLLTTGLMVYFTVWLMFFHVSGDGLYYPIDTFHKRIPKQWVHRAIEYNTHEFDEFSNYTIIPPNSKTLLDDDDKLIIPGTPAPTNRTKLVCYYNFPASNDTYRRLQASEIEPHLCTHLNLAFANVVDSKIYLSDEHLQVVEEIMQLKTKNKKLKVLISVGGAGQENGFPNMVKDHENRKIFIKSILDYVKNHKFDGVDLDWEFPATNANPKTKERMHFTQLLHEIRNEINRQEHFKFLLTVAVAAPVFIVDVSYDISYMNEYVDFVNLMSYDYHFYTKWTPFTGMNAPLYAREVDIGYFSTLNINYTVHYWLNKGISRDKLVVGLPTYGHSFRLVNSYNHGINAAANDYGSLGTFGFVGYNELCIFLKRNQITPMFDLVTRSAFATRNHEWVAFDDRQSLTYKTEFIKANRFAGVMVYALNTDDHAGVCMENNTTKFPLTKTIKYTLTG